MKIPASFYLQEDVIEISKQLLGKVLCTQIEGEELTAGIIVETEAYAGVTDKASHAYQSKKTPRTQTMYQIGGTSYVYLIYGCYHLFNIVTHKIDVPHAVLIRAIEPIQGVETMQKRRKLEKFSNKISAGPGLLTQALGINKMHNGLSLTESNIWLEDQGISVSKNNIIASPRVNVSYAAEDALIPWRFRIKNNKWVSPAK